MKKRSFFMTWLVCMAMLDWLPVLGQGLPWPINPKQINRLFAGYGTYDDGTILNFGVHMHEGLDILAAADTEVYASEDGEVLATNALDNPGYMGCVFVSRKKKLDEALCYIHIVVQNNPATKAPWKKGDAVKAGDLLGKIFKENGIEPHLHFDWRIKKAGEEWFLMMLPWVNERGILLREYMPEFNGNPIELLDPIKDDADNKPTFSNPIHYKLQDGDYFKTTIGSGDTVIKGNVDIVARINETFGPAKTTSYNIGPRKIDWTMEEYKPGNVVKTAKQTPVNFSGLFLKEEQARKYNISDTRLAITGETVTAEGTATISAEAGKGRNAQWKFYKNFTSPQVVPGTNPPIIYAVFKANFGNLINTIYSADATCKSVPRDPGGTDRGIYWYFLTNIDDKNNDIESRDSAYYWDTNGKEGQAWNNNSDKVADEARGNKDAAFPDGRYILTITAQGYGDDKDVASRKDTVSVNNFDEFIFSCDANGKEQDSFCINAPVYIKGTGFPKNRSFRVFVIKDRKWVDGDVIPGGANRVAAATVTSDANGDIKPVVIWNAYKPNGDPDRGYHILLDYNWDSIYSSPKLGKTVDVLDEKPGPFGIIGKKLEVKKARTHVKCYGECTGTITLTVTGGTAPYTFFWRDDDNSAIGPNRTGLCAGTYEVYIRDANDCGVWDTITITEPAKLKAMGNKANTNCGQCNGVAYISATGGTPPYSYSWPGGQMDSLCAGTYTGWVTDANGCTDSCTATIDSSYSNLSASCTVYNASPCDACNGVATITATGGMPPYIYNWPGGTLSNLCPGTYIGTVTDANGCTDSCTATVYGLPSNLNVTGYGTSATCGQCNGTATMTATGGTAPYTYNWPGGTLSNLCPGTYTGMVTDANGCTSICSVIVGGTDAVTVTGVASPAYCGQCNGSATLIASGGRAPYTYSWPGGTLSNLCPGTYTGTVTDANGCTDSCTVTVYDTPSYLSVYGYAIAQATCGQCNGSATMMASGGTAPYTYSWPGGTLSNLCPGTYTGTVTDANGCTDSCTVTIYDMPSDLNVSGYATDAACGECNGTVYLMASGGTAPYTYSWPGGMGTGLCPGTYTAWVTDANGCTDSCTVTVYGDTVELSLDCYVEGASCGQCNGSATMMASGGTPPYSYSWPGGSMTGLCPGMYTGWVTDAKGCVTTCAFTILQDSATLNLSASATPATCGQCNGSATVMASGGTPPYSYSWPGATLTNLCAGTYWVTVTDAVGCTESTWVTVGSDSSGLQVSCSATDATCGQCNGTATMMASGGTAPYTYSWPGGSISGLCPGTYTGTVTDAKGCVASCTATVNQSSSLSVGCMWTDATCDSCNGSVAMFASGGTAPYTYSWPGGSMSGLCAGTYTGTVTDATGCTASCTVYVASYLSRICDTVKVDTIRYDTAFAARRALRTDKLNREDLSVLQVFPNPFDAVLNIRFHSNTSNSAQLVLQDAAGRVLQQLKVAALPGYNTATLKGGNLPSGTYFVKLIQSGTTVVKVYRR